VKRPEYPSEKESQVLTYVKKPMKCVFLKFKVIPREGLKEKDMKKLRKKVQKLEKVDHKQISIPEKVIVSKSKLYYVFPLQKDKPFKEAYSMKNSISLLFTIIVNRRENNQTPKIL